MSRPMKFKGSVNDACSLSLEEIAKYSESDQERIFNIRETIQRDTDMYEIKLLTKKLALLDQFDFDTRIEYIRKKNMIQGRLDGLVNKWKFLDECRNKVAKALDKKDSVDDYLIKGNENIDFNSMITTSLDLSEFKETYPEY